MAQIRANNVTFSYEGSPDPVFCDLSFHLDSSWKTGLIGRNGRGKTTLLRLLMGGLSHEGSIVADTAFDYFPYALTDADLASPAEELAAAWKPGIQSWEILTEMNQMGMDAACLYRPFGELSHGERTLLMLCVLFAREGEFLLIDEPTNHLDGAARESVKTYLAAKKGFLLVSHDRDLIDAVVDHVLVLNRETVEVQAGNFSSWWENKERSDACAVSENEKHLREIRELRAAADRSRRWADNNEGTKIGFDPVKEHERNISTRAYIGAKTKKMQARVKSYENRMAREIAEKEGLLRDIERPVDLKLFPLTFHKEVLIRADHLSLRYGEGKPLFEDISFELKRGDRLVLTGGNGCGKSSIIRAVLAQAGVAEGMAAPALPHTQGMLETASGLIISYVSQDTSHLRGSLRDFCRARSLSESLFLAILRQLDLGRGQFTKPMEDFSEGQKKKVLLAASLLTPAHLYIWDEPFNYIDVFSRAQIEKLILTYTPTMLLVEHDVRFRETAATKEVRVGLKT